MADQDLGAALSRVQSYQYPTTHAGHLSPEQAGSLEKFKALCAQKGYYRPARSGQNASHDDETLLRYLRARKFVPQDAFGQFKDTEDWRKENRIDDLYETIDVQEYDDTRRLYPQWTGCRDKRGIPVYVFEVAHLDSKRMSAYEKSIAHGKSYGSVSPKLMRLFALYENLLNFSQPLCSGISTRPFPETPVSQSNNIVDISGVGLKQFWNLKQHMQDASTLATAHYPETLDRIFIIGAPSFFPTVWGWIKRWFDPITVSKIFILPQNEVKSTLLKYIDEENIPKKYGGKLNWEWGTMPNLEPQIVESLRWENPVNDGRGGKGFPLGPVKFVEEPNGDMVAWAVGSQGGKKRHVKVATLPGKNNQTRSGPRAMLSRKDTETDPSGWHTHPTEEEQEYPKSGHTPPDHSPTLHPMVGGTRGLPPGFEVSNNPQHPRQGTSLTSFAAQSQTHASGQLAEGTPLSINSGYNDRHTTYEPSTIGQAPKNVDIPYREEPQDNSYLGQAKSVLHTAYIAAENAEETVLEKLGYGHKHEEEPHVEQKQAAPDDPRVAKMPNRDVEDFLRSKYADYDTPGHKRGK